MLITGYYLLRRIGVAHGDISIGNLMYNADCWEGNPERL